MEKKKKSVHFVAEPVFEEIVLPKAFIKQGKHNNKLLNKVNDRAAKKAIL